MMIEGKKKGMIVKVIYKMFFIGYYLECYLFLGLFFLDVFIVVINIIKKNICILS